MLRNPPGETFMGDDGIKPSAACAPEHDQSPQTREASSVKQLSCAAFFVCEKGQARPAGGSDLHRRCGPSPLSARRVFDAERMTVGENQSRHRRQGSRVIGGRFGFRLRPPNLVGPRGGRRSRSHRHGGIGIPAAVWTVARPRRRERRVGVLTPCGVRFLDGVGQIIAATRKNGGGERAQSERKACSNQEHE